MSERDLPVTNHTPMYNIKAVARLVGLLPVTLRAWERRYGLPTPTRGGQGYRLYSEYDVRILRWLKGQIEAGMSIGRASELLHDLRTRGQDPAIEANPVASQATSLDVLKEQLKDALIHFDETAATSIVRRAFSLYAIDQVLVEMLQPVLVEMGEAWHRGELPIAVEHFATQFSVQHLMSIISASALPFRHGVIVAACAPGELHQIGMLMLVAMLRWRGWDVKYLGPDLKLDRLAEALGPIHPRMLLFTATRPEAALALRELPDLLERFPSPRPRVVLGGQAFRLVEGPLPGQLIEGTPAEIVQAIELVMLSAPAQNGISR